MTPKRRYIKIIAIILVLVGIFAIIFGPRIGEYLQAPRVTGMHLTGVSYRSVFCIESCTPTTYHYKATGTEEAIVKKITDNFQRQGYKLGNYENKVNPSGYYCSTDLPSSYDVYNFYKQDGSYLYPPTLTVIFHISNPSSGFVQLGCGRPTADYQIRIIPGAGR